MILVTSHCPPCSRAPDLLLLLWPVFFIAATREEPQLKARNFRKCVTRGVEQARRTTMIIAEARPRRQGQENFTVCCNQAVSKSEERAAWEATSGYTRHRVRGLISCKSFVRGLDYNGWTLLKPCCAGPQNHYNGFKNMRAGVGCSSC